MPLPKYWPKRSTTRKSCCPWRFCRLRSFWWSAFLINILFGVQWLNFSPGGETIVHGNFFSTWLVDIIFIPTLFFAVAVFALGLKRFVADMHANALQEGKTNPREI
jgi:hypothetical protein